MISWYVGFFFLVAAKRISRMNAVRGRVVGVA